MTNYLTATDFAISLNTSAYPGLACDIITFNHPSVSVGSAKHPTPRRIIPLPGDKFEYTSLTVTVLADKELASYITAYNWLKDLVEDCDNPLENKTSDIRLLVKSVKNNLTKTITYARAFPVDIGGLTFSTVDNSDTFVTFDITFEYAYFEIS